MSIADLVNGMDKSLLPESVETKLDNLLNSLPYTAVHDLKFVCRDKKVFSVRDLPIITQDILEGAFRNEANRIAKLSYQINANGIKHQELNFFIKRLK